MKAYRIYFAAALLALLMATGRTLAQSNASSSVLSGHTWLRIPVTEEGIYKIDYATLSAMGVDMGHLHPEQIRLFGNPSGALPESNAEQRPDDLTEMAVYVSGAADGVFDATDFVLFYGQEPTRWNLSENSVRNYERDRNYYSDTTFYYLCTDSGENGLRIQTKPTLPVLGATTVISEFPDFAWHEEELFSPFNVSRNWYGEMLTFQDSTLHLDFHFPNLVKDKPVNIKCGIMGRAVQRRLHYEMKANGNVLVSNGTIETVSNSYLYGIAQTIERQMFSDSDTLGFDLKLFPDQTSPTLLLDYVEFYYWRKLIREGWSFPFRLVPKQFGADTTAVWVQNVSAEFELWEVSDPLRPVVQEGLLSADNFVFATVENTEKRYLMFVPAAARPVTSWTEVPNQNLHAIADADMLILTLPKFSEQAEDLARFHQERDGLTSIIVNVREIYNEFSTGVPDPTGMRDFIRMVYQRSGRLKYVLLFGRPSFDFRNLKGAGYDFVPCYEDKIHGYAISRSAATDDYFGLMDANEGAGCAGRVDLGIGRIPVTTEDEAQAMVDKIKRYCDPGNHHGEWKTRGVFLADDDDAAYVSSSEKYVSILDTTCHAMNPYKVYTSAYPSVNTSNGVRIPQANADLMDALNKGQFLMAYTGHGGVKGLTGESVFTLSDIISLKNGDRQPFVFTATCEFSKYDDATLVSAGERMFLLPNDGAIAMATTSRPTYGGDNTNFGKAFMNQLFRRDSTGKPQRLGDLMKAAKIHPNNFGTSAESKNLNFFLMGDPAMRLAIPELGLEVTKINGNDVESDLLPPIHAMSMVSLEGEVRTHAGIIDTQFNGELWMTLYDRKAPIVLSANQSGTACSHYKDVICQSRVSVSNGRFTVSFQLPEDLGPDYGKPRFGFYAYDSIRNVEAMGVFDRISLGGSDPSVHPDNEGPQISFYWNTPSFQNGDVTDREGMLYADLYDAQGIYHYDFSLGRNMQLTSNYAAYDNKNLNAYYEPALDDFRRGRIALPVALPGGGTFEFNLKVWDMQNNASTAQVWFVVEDDIFLSGVRNYPNPFQDETFISITHTGDGGDFHVEVEVFDIMGRKVAVLSKEMYLDDNQTGRLRWDGRDNFGHALPTGIYIYRLTMTDGRGTSRTVSQRLMIGR